MRPKTDGSQRPVVIAALILAWGAVGCDAQVTPEYRGERLATIRGNIVAQGSASAARAALLWWTPLAAAGGVVGTSVTTEGTFPAAFTVAVYRNPPREALFGAGQLDAGPLILPGFPDENVTCAWPVADAVGGEDTRLAIASVAAVRTDSFGDPWPENIIGLATDVALIFLPRALSPGAPGARVLGSSSGGGLSAGYHLMKAEWLDLAPGDADALECRWCGPGVAAGWPCGGPAGWLRLRESEGGMRDTMIEIRLRGT